MQAATDMEVDDTEEMAPVQEVDYFRFTAEREQVGPSHERGRNGRRRPSHAKHQTSAERSAEHVEDVDLMDIQETGGAGLSQDENKSASALEEPQSDWKVEPVQKALSSSVIPLPHQQAKPAPDQKSVQRDTPSQKLQRMVLGELVPNAPDLGFGASLLQECASKQMPAEEEVAALGGEEEPESGETDDVTEDAEAGPTNDEETVVDRDESDASPHQGEEEPQQLSQVDECARREALQQWLEILEAVPDWSFGLGGSPEHREAWKRTLNESLDKTKDACKAGLKNLPRLQSIMNELVDDFNLGHEHLSPRQLQQLFRRAMSFRCLRRPLRACFDARECRDQFWLASASVLIIFTRYPAVLRKRLEFVRGIIDHFGVFCEMLRTENAPLRNMLLCLTRGLIDRCVPVPDSLCLDPIFDVIIKQTVAQAKADVSAPARTSGEDIYRLIRVCTLLTCFVRSHGNRLRPFLFRHGALEAVARLAGHAEPRVAIRAVQFLHACLMTRDPHYVVVLMQGDLLAPAIATLRSASCARTEVADAVKELIDMVLTADAPVAAFIPHLFFPGA